MKMRRSERKRYLILLGITAMALIGLMMYRSATVGEETVLKTTAVIPQNIRQMVVCKGTVSATGGTQVTAPLPCVAGEIAVSVGDRVKEGDVLITVDRSATLAMAVNAGLDQSSAAVAGAAIPSHITAPSDGLVSAVNAKTGEMLSSDTPCVVLSSGSGVQIDIAVQESLLQQVAVGQEVTVSGVAFEKEAYHGTLTHIASTARTRVNGTSSQTVVDMVVSLSPEDVDGSLLVGLSAKAAITIGEKRDVMLLPYDSVVETASGQTAVYVIEDGAAVRRTVAVGEDHADGVEVLSGVEAGAVIVTNPQSLGGETVTVMTEAE